MDFEGKIKHEIEPKLKGWYNCIRTDAKIEFVQIFVFSLYVVEIWTEEESTL